MHRPFQILLLVIYIALLFPISYSESNDEDYCSLTCDGKKHTMCKYPKGGGPECAHLKRGLKDDEIKYVIKMHEEVRDNAATGKDNGVEAANMMDVVWSAEGARIAQRWADQCTMGTARDDCRSLKSGEPGGQIVGEMGPIKIEETYNVLRTTIMDWYSKNMSYFNKDNISSYKYDERTAAYSQLVWAKTTRVGCGYTRGEMKGIMVHRLVCNYYKKGNVEGEPVYIVGSPCSKCPGQCSSIRSLCEQKHEEPIPKGDAGKAIITAYSVLICLFILFL